MPAVLRARRGGLTCALALAFASCDLPPSAGEPTTVVAAARPPVWRAVGAALRDSLEQRTRTVRDERILEVTWADPQGRDWTELRRARQVVAVGGPRDPWVAAALQGSEAAGPGPFIVHASDVWARPQAVTALVIPRGAEPGMVAALLSRLRTELLRRVQAEERKRMFSTGANRSLADSLRRSAGFSLVVPNVYRGSEPRPGLHLFRNDQPHPSQLIRQVAVASRPAEAVRQTSEEALRWRERIARETTHPPQWTDISGSRSAALRAAGQQGHEVRGRWSNPPGEWPAAGPFITRLVQCGDREYLVDAWLYAPGRPKYRYLVQMETILDSFRCPVPTAGDQAD